MRGLEQADFELDGQHARVVGEHLAMLFEGFEVADIDTPRGRVRARVGGRGAPLLVSTATRSRI